MSERPIKIGEEIARLCPELRLGVLECEVKIKGRLDELWEMIDAGCAEIAATLKTEDINSRPTIASTRAAYKVLGKDPSRYRPSAEALTRRVVKGKGLYQINNVVDLLNWTSIHTGFSIGGYDAERIEGEAVLGVGKSDEPYQAIGRGELNIAGLPLFRDDQGAFGSPTSDSERTMVNEKTHHFLMVFFDFGNHSELEAAMESAVELLERFAALNKVTRGCIKSS